MEINMDIPRVLETISDGIYVPYYWGPLSNTENSYEELASMWPELNPPLPSKIEMEDHWSSISAGE